MAFLGSHIEKWKTKLQIFGTSSLQVPMEIEMVNWLCYQINKQKNLQEKRKKWTTPTSSWVQIDIKFGGSQRSLEANKK